MCGDVIYEGARSVTGPYLYLLGGTALAVGIVAGLGEFLGYALRLVSGYLADTTRHYWALTFIGYGMLAAVPLLAFAGSWEIAALLFLAERTGKGIRAPAKDAILGNLTAGIGRGWGFGLHEALDQAGAVVGPLVFTAAYLARGDYRTGFLLLAVPFVVLLALLAYVRVRIPDPAGAEAIVRPDESPVPVQALIPYGVFTALVMAGFAAFPLLAYHFSAAGIVPDAEIPLLYAVAMAVDGIVALAAGRLYDSHGLIVLLAIPVCGAAIPVLAFGTAYAGAVAAAVLWGAVMGIQETVLRAAIADFTCISKRGRAYGIFNTVYGVAWFTGSVVIGWAYMLDVRLAVAYAVLMQLMALPVFFRAKGALERGTCKR
ncbi:MAG: MFS transporter [Methanomicrobiales archaeon]|nr:MFS transporter [Methanomicrobiales archaeon]